MLEKVKKIIYRNNETIAGCPVKKKQVNLEWWSEKDNIGDYLATVIYEWMLSNKNITSNSSKSTVHLLTVGSVIGMGMFDATIWGSGIHTFSAVNAIVRHKKIVKYDVRAVRGPITQDILTKSGYKCSDVPYGDPAVLMPLIYKAQKTASPTYRISVIHHISNDEPEKKIGCHYIDIKTKDYKHFIDELLLSEKVISSSLHGIILAESYGIPAVFLSDGMNEEYMKFYDWYYSTDRYNVKIAQSLSQAIEMDPMELPRLGEMQKNLIKTFPYDLFCY